MRGICENRNYSSDFLNQLPEKVDQRWIRRNFLKFWKLSRIRSIKLELIVLSYLYRDGSLR